MTKTVEFSWESWIASVDPDHAVDRVTVIEYEFTARGLPLEPDGNTPLHQNGYRVFRGNYASRGAYAPDEE